jgi:hypothetical protein
MQMKEKICVTGLLLWTNHGCIITSPNQSMLHCSGNIPVHIQPKGRLCHQLRRFCLPCFWVLRTSVAHFQKHGGNVNSESYCEGLLKFPDASRRKHPGQLARVYCFIMTWPDSMQPKQPRREFKNCSGNFLNSHCAAPTCPLVTYICLVC